MDPRGQSSYYINVSVKSHAKQKTHTNSGSWGSVVGGSFPLPEGELDVVGEGVREAPGSKALYMSFLRGLPPPMRSPPGVVSDGFLDTGRAGGGMLLGVGTLVVFSGSLLETVGDECAAFGRELGAIELARGGFFETDGRSWGFVGSCALC